MELPRDAKYIYADYLKWDGPQRYELVEGVPYLMAPGPTTEHQRISRILLLRIGGWLLGKSCEVFHAPFDVRLNPDTLDDTVVQPDLTIVCDPKKIVKRGCKGAPDMVIEILSASTAGYDQITKLRAYQKAGVREYWIVNPGEKAVQVYLLRDGEYMVRTYLDEETVPAAVLNGLEVDLVELFSWQPAEEATDE